MKKSLTSRSLIAALLSFGVGLHAALADSIGGTSSGTITGTSSGSITSTGLSNPLAVSSISDLISAIIGYMITIGTSVLVVMLIYTGFQFVIARGNEEKVSNARTALLWTVVGGLILLGAKVIQSAISATVGAL